jgi:hypothetical protein
MTLIKQQNIVAADLPPQVIDEFFPTVEFVRLGHVSEDVPYLHGCAPDKSNTPVVSSFKL